MAVAQPPELAELEHSDEILLQELQRVDEILLDELERVDERLIRIVAAIDQLPERVASTRGRDRPGSVPRPFDPFGEDEVGVVAAENTKPVAGQVVSRVQSWVAGLARDRDPLELVTLSLGVALLTTTIAVVSLIVAVAR
ncbi:MAG TPA: hypothetical protein VGE91_10225 [Solirubrobacterales bacterium]|jgi:hypothetical protein